MFIENQEYGNNTKNPLNWDVAQSPNQVILLLFCFQCKVLLAIDNLNESVFCSVVMTVSLVTLQLNHNVNGRFRCNSYLCYFSTPSTVRYLFWTTNCYRDFEKIKMQS